MTATASNTRQRRPKRSALADWRWIFAGVYTRYMIRHYLWFMMVVLLAITAAVTAINVSSEIAPVWKNAEIGGALQAFLTTARYVSLRIMDNGSQIFPIACILGVLWAEVAHVTSGRLTTIRTVGMPFTRRAKAVVIIAVMTIAAQLFLDNVVRPYAFMSLSREGLGEYGWKYMRERSPNLQWFAFGGNMIQARLGDDPDPEFSEVTVYYFDEAGDLENIADARRLVRGPEGSDEWELENATLWAIDAREGENGRQTHVGKREMLAPLGFSISPRWLRFRGIQPKYIPLFELIALAGDRNLPDARIPYREWLSMRSLLAFTTGMNVLCISAIFAFVLDLSGLLFASGLALFAGYSGYFLSRIAIVLTENGIISPLVALGTLTVFFALIFIALSIRIMRRDAIE